MGLQPGQEGGEENYSLVSLTVESHMAGPQSNISSHLKDKQGITEHL